MSDDAAKALITKLINEGDEKAWKMFLATEMVGQTKHLAEINGTIKTHEKRISTLERWKLKVLAITSFILIVAGLVKLYYFMK